MTMTMTTTTNPIAVVHFRTEPNGSFRWMRGKKRGYWRVLLVRDVRGSKNRRSKNVIEEVYRGRSGIRGVTERSSYWIGDDRTRAHQLAEKLNAETAAQEKGAKSP